MYTTQINSICKLFQFGAFAYFIIKIYRENPRKSCRKCVWHGKFSFFFCCNPAFSRSRKCCFVYSCATFCVAHQDFIKINGSLSVYVSIYFPSRLCRSTGLGAKCGICIQNYIPLYIYV